MKVKYVKTQTAVEDRRSLAIYKKKIIEFDGTVPGLVKQLHELGAVIGESLQVSFDSQKPTDLENYIITGRVKYPYIGVCRI